MKTRKFFLIWIAAVLSVCSGMAQPALSADGIHTATVGKDEAVFVFPLEPQKQYEWYADKGVLQYAWHIRVHNKGKDYEFGYFFFPTEAGKGNLDELMRSGQFDVWAVTKDEGSVVPGVRVEFETSPDGKQLKIILRDKKAIQLLFSDRPRTVVFQSRVIGNTTSNTVPVTYR